MAYFKEEREVESTEDNDKQLIDDFDVLITSFNKISDKFEMMLEEGKNIIAPLVEEVVGDNDTSRGLIGELQTMFKKYPFMERMQITTKMKEVAQKSKELVIWQLRQTQYFEDFIFGVKHENGKLISHGFLSTNESAFEIIKRMKMEASDLKARIKALEDEKKEISTDVNAFKPVRKPINPNEDNTPLSSEDIEKFRNQFEIRFQDYADSIFNGKMGEASTKKAKLFSICWGNKQKLQLCNMWFDEEQEFLDDKINSKKVRKKRVISKTRNNGVSELKKSSEKSLYVRNGTNKSNMGQDSLIPDNKSDMEQDSPELDTRHSAVPKYSGNEEEESTGFFPKFIADKPKKKGNYGEGK